MDETVEDIMGRLEEAEEEILDRIEEAEEASGEALTDGMVRMFEDEVIAEEEAGLDKDMHRHVETLFGEMRVLRMRKMMDMRRKRRLWQRLRLKLKLSQSTIRKIC